MTSTQGVRASIVCFRRGAKVPSRRLPGFARGFPEIVKRYLSKDSEDLVRLTGAEIQTIDGDQVDIKLRIEQEDPSQARNVTPELLADTIDSLRGQLASNIAGAIIWENLGKGLAANFFEEDGVIVINIFRTEAIAERRLGVPVMK
ncbi:MAG: hypothetical protein ABIA67_05325 [Candidatus Margulisiibacteriota bacterium]